MFTPAPRKVLPLPLTISIVSLSFEAKDVVEMVAFPLSPVCTTYREFEALPVVVITRFPESMVVPFFFTFTSKFPPIGSVTRLIRSDVTVKALPLFSNTTPSYAVQLVANSATIDGHPAEIVQLLSALKS